MGQYILIYSYGRTHGPSGGITQRISYHQDTIPTAQNISEIQKIFYIKHTSTRFHTGDNHTRQTYVTVTVAPGAMSSSSLPFIDNLISFP